VDLLMPNVLGAIEVINFVKIKLGGLIQPPTHLHVGYSFRVNVHKIKTCNLPSHFWGGYQN